MKTLPRPSTAHIAWATLGIVLDDTHCTECGRGLSFDTDGNIWCWSCDGVWADTWAVMDADS